MARDVPQNYREFVIRQQTVVRNGARRPGRDLRLVTRARNTPKSKRQGVILSIRQNTVSVQQIANGVIRWRRRQMTRRWPRAERRWAAFGSPVL